MGALWSEDDGVAAGPGARPGRRGAIDLHAAPPYDAAAGAGDPAARRAPPRDPDARRSARRGVAGFGLWLREDDAMRESGRDRLVRWLRFVLHTDDTPSRAALAFALGVFIAWTPVVGLHTVIALGLAFLLRLNRVAVLAGTFVNNPWTIVPIYSSSAWLGLHLTGSDAPLPRLEGITSFSALGEFLAQLQPWIVPIVTGTLVLGTLCALLSFPIVLCGIRWYRALRRAG